MLEMPSACGAEQRVAGRCGAFAPCGLQRPVRTVFFKQPVVPESGQFPEQFGVESGDPVQVFEKQRAFVVEFDADHGRIVGQRGACVGIDMREEPARPLFLRIDPGFRKAVGPFAEPGPGGRAVGRQQRAVDFEPHHKIDSLLFELGDEVVEPVEMFRIEVAGTGPAEVDQRVAVAVAAVEVVKADDVDAVFSQPCRNLFRRIAVKLENTVAADADAEKADRFVVAGSAETAVFDDDAPVGTRRLVVEERYVGRRAELIVVPLEREGVIPLRHGGGIQGELCGAEQDPACEKLSQEASLRADYMF